MIEKRQTFVVSDQEGGLRLDQFLTSKFPHFSRNDWQERIRSGRVTVDGGVVRPSKRARGGETISFTYLQRPEPEVDRGYSVVFRDDWILVLNKPANLTVHPSGIYHKNTLTALLEIDLGIKPLLVNRLDRETSGTMLAAFDSTSAATLQRAMRSGGFRKEYDVIVEGEFPDYLDARGFLTAGTGPVRKKRRYVPDRMDGAEAVRTEFWLVEQMASPTLSLLRAGLHTGRLHQIRATLCSLGFPVTGDRLYGVDEGLYLKHIHDAEDDADRARLRINRTALHSRLLSFPHPRTGETLVFETPMPDDMAGLCNS